MFALRVKTICNWGFHLDKVDLCMTVNAYLMKQNQVVKEFANNIPGDDWVAHFMGRHGLTHRIATNIRRKHAQSARNSYKNTLMLNRN